MEEMLDDADEIGRALTASRRSRRFVLGKD